MRIEDAQRDLRQAFLGGAPGVLASALVWLTASVVAFTRSPPAAIGTLLVGGMFIHPLGLLLGKLAGRSGAVAPTNALGRLALEGTVWMLLAIPLAYAASRHHLPWFFPAMLLVIGGRYLTFQTLYGLRTYWACGATLALAAFALVYLRAPFEHGALVGGLIELVFAGVIYASVRGERYEGAGGKAG